MADNQIFGHLTEDQHSSNITPLRQNFGDKIQINIPHNDEPPRVQKHRNPEDTIMPNVGLLYEDVINQDA